MVGEAHEGLAHGSASQGCAVLAVKDMGRVARGM